MRYLNLVLPLLPIIITTGCNTVAQKRNAIIEKIPPDERAYIIGKYSVACKPVGSSCSQHFNSITLHYRDINTKSFPGTLSSTVGSIFGGNTEHDFISQASHEQGIYFCYALPPDNYEFYTVNYYSFSGGGSGYTLKEDAYFSLPFTLTHGELAYVGNFKMTTRIGSNAFGMPLRTAGQLVISNGNEDDMSKALDKCPASVRSKRVKIIDFNRKPVRHPILKYEN